MYRVRGRVGIEPRAKRGRRTECSSCLTSRTWPSLKVHLTTSVSGEAPLTVSLEASLDQKLAKFSSLEGQRVRSFRRICGGQHKMYRVDGTERPT